MKGNYLQTPAVGRTLAGGSHGFAAGGVWLGSIPDGRDALPDLGQVIKALTIVFVFDAAAHAEFLEDGHHLAHWQTGNLSGAAKRGFALLVFLNGEQDSGVLIAGISRAVRRVIHPDLG